MGPTRREWLNKLGCFHVTSKAIKNNDAEAYLMERKMFMICFF